MPRTRPPGEPIPTLRQRDDGGYFVDYRLNGKRLRYSLKTRNPTVAKRKFKKIVAELELGVHGAPSPKTVSEFADEFLKHQRSLDRKPKTVRSQEHHLEKSGEVVGPDRRLGDVRPANVSASWTSSD